MLRYFELELSLQNTAKLLVAHDLINELISVWTCATSDETDGKDQWWV